MSYSEKTKDLYLSQLADIKNAGIFKEERFIHSSQAADIEVEFPSGSDLKKVINMCSNNYLGLTNHPEIKAAAARALDDYGTGTAGSRFLNGTLEIHVELEEKLARFMKREAALTFSTGFQVNLGVISTIIGRPGNGALGAAGEPEPA